MAFVAYWMKARGLSLKPVWWFIGSMLLIRLPQLVYHVIVAASNGGAGLPDSKIEDPQSLFNVVPGGAWESPLRSEAKGFGIGITIDGIGAAQILVPQ